MPVYNQSRSRVIQLVFIAVFIVIIGQLLHLQLFSSEYKIQAESNAIYRKVVYPDRGIIYDRKKRAILENTVMYDLIVTPYEIKGIDTNTLCTILGIDTAEFRKRMLTAIIKNSGYKPSVFAPLVSDEIYARLNENMYKFNGFILQERPVRKYPYNAAGNVLGYLGEVDTTYLRRHKEDGYEMGDYAGMTGLERSYEKVLMGQRGVQRFIRDNKNRITGPYENRIFDTAAIAGRNLYTSLDIDLQQLAENLLQNKIGSAVAIDPKTGGILAMATSPSYNPNLLTGSQRRQNFGKLVLDTARPLLNRAIKGQYPPGSTFKPMGALIALDEKLITPSYGYPCGGAYYACGVRVRCEHHDPGHAANLRLALAHSCNAYFSNVFRMAIDNPAYESPQAGYLKWKEYMNAFGMGVPLNVDLPSEDRGNIPDTGRYNKDFG
ncbi:MAG TPA: penicillin-binding transpeptidase domain-containing protein, partial [Chitinophagaceae bacterium]|nr:penicillin-binding transpeptidase domain-containing protein [Chitinophagaceae bacterium]